MKKLARQPQAPAELHTQPGAQVQFLFVPETKASRALGWQTAITAVVGIAVSPRETKLAFQPVTGGMVLVDDVAVDQILEEAKTNSLNTPMAKSRVDLKAEFSKAVQAHGARVSAYMHANPRGSKPEWIGIDMAKPEAAPGTEEQAVQTEAPTTTE